MPLPRLTQSFCGVSLEIGTKVIAILHMVCAIVFLVLTILELTKGRYISVPEEDDVIKNPYFNLAVASVIGLLIGIFFAAVLFYGAHVLSPAKLLPWIIFITVGVVISLVDTIYVSMSFLYVGIIGPGLCNFFGGLAIIVLQCYAILVVYSFYREMKDSPTNAVNYAVAPQNEEFQPPYHH